MNYSVPVLKKYMAGRRCCVYVSAKRWSDGATRLALRSKYGYLPAEETTVHRENLFDTKKEADAVAERQRCECVEIYAKFCASFFKFDFLSTAKE